MWWKDEEEVMSKSRRTNKHFMDDSFKKTKKRVKKGSKTVKWDWKLERLGNDY